MAEHIVNTQFLISTILFISQPWFIGLHFLKYRVNTLLLCFYFLHFLLQERLELTMDLQAQFLFYMPFVFAAIHLFLLTGNLILNATIKCGLGILVLFQLYYGTVKFNYRQAPIEFDKMENHELSPFLSGLKTHKEMLTLKSDLAFLKNYELSNLFLFSTEGGISLLTELEPVPFGWLQPGKESNALRCNFRKRFSRGL